MGKGLRRTSSRTCSYVGKHESFFTSFSWPLEDKSVKDFDQGAVTSKYFQIANMIFIHNLKN